MISIREIIDGRLAKRSSLELLSSGDRVADVRLRIEPLTRDLAADFGEDLARAIFDADGVRRDEIGETTFKAPGELYVVDIAAHADLPWQFRIENVMVLSVRSYGRERKKGMVQVLELAIRLPLHEVTMNFVTAYTGCECRFRFATMQPELPDQATDTPGVQYAKRRMKQLRQEGLPNVG